jgi:hypothetical protein
MSSTSGIPGDVLGAGETQVGNPPVFPIVSDAEREAALQQARSVLAQTRKASLNEMRPHAPVPTGFAAQPVAPVVPMQYNMPAVRPAGKGPRRVRLTVARVDPWSVMKMAFLLSVAMGIMAVIATTLFWLVIDHLQVFTTLQEFINDAVGTGATVNIQQYFEFGRIVSLATLIAVVNVIILTILAAIMAILYNITATLIGGVRVTMTDD